MKIYISGLYSGTNPQPGVGIARSLRAAYPDATLIGVEYSNRCSGIHWEDFDDIWLQRPWEELNLDVHAGDIKRVLDSGALWISSIDLEIMWLAGILPDGHPNLLTPPLTAVDAVGKPAIPAHKGLPVKIPTFVTTEISDWDLHTFCRENDWRVWLKGPYYEAVHTPSWAEFEAKRNILSKAWATEKLFLQRHVSGYEESVCISAYRGELLDCVLMRKRDLTEIGKTWAGDISSVDEDFLLPLRKILRRINWTGGAELEMVRDADGERWLLEWNPRYPAWIHGATITGRNLPAALVEGCTGIPPAEPTIEAEEFTRVVLEIPVRREYPLGPLPEPLGGYMGHSLKHPSGLVQFADRLHKEARQKTAEHNNGHVPNAENGIELGKMELPESYISDLAGIDISTLETPAGVFMPVTATGYFEEAAKTADRVSTEEITVTNAYSIKTNPDLRLVKLALDSGFFAEAISILEVQTALAAGFAPEQIIFNGPAKWWRSSEVTGKAFHTVFCDSIGDLENAVDKYESGEISTEYLGVRLRTANIDSRFGIPIDTPKAFDELIAAIEKIPRSCRFGIHFHMASSNIGVAQWWHLFESMLRWCASVEALSGRMVETLDIGGGWFPNDMKSAEDRLAKAITLIPEFLPNVHHVFCEPGKALAQPSMALAMHILEIRKLDGDSRDVVVDGSIAELPMYFFYPHRILHRKRDDKRWTPLRRGNSRLLGRLCMEHDIVAWNVELPDSAGVDDLLVFCDAGAYDRSMSYVFGCG